MTEKFIFFWTYVYNILSYVCIFVLFYLSDFVVFLLVINKCVHLVINSLTSRHFLTISR